MLITELINASLTLSNGGMGGGICQAAHQSKVAIRYLSTENDKFIFSIYVTEPEYINIDFVFPHQKNVLFQYAILSQV